MSSEKEVIDLVADLVADPEPQASTCALEDEQALRQLHAEAVRACKEAVRRAEDARDEEIRAMGERLRAEQDRFLKLLMSRLPEAVRQAAGEGKRTATLLQFSGSDKLDEFCYLYMLKGPVNPESRAEMKAMGVKPLMHGLRAGLGRAGFGVHHAWQRATNDNLLSVSW